VIVQVRAAAGTITAALAGEGAPRQVSDTR